MGRTTTSLQNRTLTSSLSSSPRLDSLAISMQRFKVAIVDLLTGRHYRVNASGPSRLLMGTSLPAPEGEDCDYHHQHTNSNNNKDNTQQ